MKIGYVYIALTTFLFSTMEIMLKKVGGDFSPIQICLSRFLVGGLVLLPFARKSLKEREITIEKSHIIEFIILGFICVVLSMSFYQLAILNTKASVVAVLFSCNPVFTVIFAYLILREEIHKNNIISLVLQVIGIIFIINPLNTKLSIKGIVFTLLAAITFSLYAVRGKKMCSKFGGITVTCGSFIFGSLEMISLVLISKIDFIFGNMNISIINLFSQVNLFEGYAMNNILYIIYIYIFITGIGFVLYFRSMEETSTSTASLVFFFKPVLSSILAFIILKETIPLNMIIGILFIIIGSIVSIIPNKKIDK